jgi:hypothetical protein
MGKTHNNHSTRPLFASVKRAHRQLINMCPTIARIGSKAIDYNSDSDYFTLHETIVTPPPL